MSIGWILRLVSAAGFGVAGWRLGELLSQVSSDEEEFLPWGLAFSLSGVPIGALVAPYISTVPLTKGLHRLNRIPTSALVSSAIGLFIGLVTASLISVPLYSLDGWLGWGVPLAVSLSLGAVGFILGFQRHGDLWPLLAHKEGARGAIPNEHYDKIVVDTSAIIDGRIADLSRTGFLQGTLMIPGFVLDEIRHIADSADPLRRGRGRRGLEMLAKLRSEASVPVEVLEHEMAHGTEVDSLLVRMAHRMKAPILTTDFNLNRVAEVHGIQVLNINELANALKPIVVPGEELTVNIVQEGKEVGQGVGFMDDGTMIVVEGGKRFINSVRDVIVTRVLQTAAGRLIFAHPK